MTRLRLASHSLRIQTGRFGPNRIDREHRTCLLCEKTEVEDEFHFVLVCHVFADLRKKYIDKYYYVRPSAFKFIQLLQNESKTVLIKLAKFIKEAFIFRNSLINAMN